MTNTYDIGNIGFLLIVLFFCPFFIFRKKYTSNQKGKISKNIRAVSKLEDLFVEMYRNREIYLSEEGVQFLKRLDEMCKEIEEDFKPIKAKIDVLENKFSGSFLFPGTEFMVKGEKLKVEFEEKILLAKIGSRKLNILSNYILPSKISDPDFQKQVHLAIEDGFRIFEEDLKNGNKASIFVCDLVENAKTLLSYFKNLPDRTLFLERADKLLAF
jgi:hypothetical protein